MPSQKSAALEAVGVRVVPSATGSCGARSGPFTRTPGGPTGHPRVHAELVAQGCRVSRKRVARLMREAGLAGASRRRGTGTTRVDPSHRAVPDQVERQFQADAPDRIWVADITPTCRLGPGSCT